MDGGRQTFLFSATMASNYDRYVSKELLYGKQFDEKNLALCGHQLMDADDEDDNLDK
mgnify:CR=1 FL=1